jgi:hypothetical protein
MISFIEVMWHHVWWSAYSLDNFMTQDRKSSAVAEQTCEICHCLMQNMWSVSHLCFDKYENAESGVKRHESREGVLGKRVGIRRRGGKKENERSKIKIYAYMNMSQWIPLFCTINMYY